MKLNYFVLLTSLGVWSLLSACEKDEPKLSNHSVGGSWFLDTPANEGSPIGYRSEYTFDVDSAYTFTQRVIATDQPEPTAANAYIDSGSYRAEGDRLSTYNHQIYYRANGSSSPADAMILQETRSEEEEVRIIVRKNSLTLDYPVTPCPPNASCISEITYYRKTPASIIFW